MNYYKGSVMKRFLVILLLLSTANAWGADAKVTSLGAITPDTTDMLYCVDDVSGTPTSKSCLISATLIDANIPNDITIDLSTTATTANAGDSATSFWSSGTCEVARGCTGAATLIDGGILLGSGTLAITALGVATNGQIPIGDGTTDPVLATITGGTNLTITNNPGSITADVDDAFLVNNANDSTTGILTSTGIIVTGEFEAVASGVSVINNTFSTDGAVTFRGLRNCETIATDANGLASCDDDATVGAGVWTDTDPVLLNTTTRDVVVGAAQKNTSKFTVENEADQVGVTFQGHSTQTNNIFIIEESDGTDIASASTVALRVAKNFKAASGVQFESLTNCDMFNTDSGGVLSCGTEVNNLETITTGIATTEIPIGTAANTVVYAALSADATMDNAGAVTLAATNTNLTTLANVTTVGALNAGSITSGFGAIDNGSSNITSTGVIDFGGATSTEIANSATPTTNTTGEIALDTTIIDHQPLLQYFDGVENMTVIAIDTAELPALDNEIVKYDAVTDKFVLEADAGGGNTTFNLPLYSAKLTGAFVTMTPAGCSTTASTQGAAIDAGDGNWRLLFDATTDEAAVWQFKMPSNYSSAPVLKVNYAMTSATTLDVEFEGAIMCVTPGDAADIGTASFANCAVDTETVPGTAGHTDTEISITLTDDSCAAGDTVFVWLSTDSDDAINDDSTGDREVVHAALTYTGS